MVVTDWSRLTCSDNTGKTLQSQPEYDISACDVSDEGLDVVFSKNEVFHANTTMPPWRYWICTVLAVALVRTLSHNVHRVWVIQKEPELVLTQKPALAGVLGIIILVLVDGDFVYITHTDQLFFWSSASYVGFYLVIQGVERTQLLLHQDETMQSEQETPVFNIIIGTLQVLATRVYCAAETPYNTVLMFMLACRAWIKVITQERRVNTRQSLTLVCDSVYLSLACELAYTGGDGLLIAVIGVAYVAARVVVYRHTVQNDVFTSNKKEDRQ